MVVAIIVGVCIVLLLLAFLVPRLSHGPQRGAGKAPGPLGRLGSKSFGKSRKATNKSAAKGRQGRGKLPL